jgi:putative membrane protein
MRRFARNHVLAITGILTLVSLTLVVSAVRGFIPTSILPKAPSAVLAVIPPTNAGLSLVAIGTILTGIRAIRAGDIDRHRRLMVTSFGLFALFLGLYLYRVSLVGPTHFAGPAWLETFLYLPVLIIHMGLAILCLPLVYYVLVLAYAYPVERLAETRHPQVGRVAATLWLISFGLGIVVYLLLYVVF